ncbi:orotidine-5'-phosphate decarboxylase [Halalkalibaculum sp. DA3122]|uniref:orotidine-5'-phosphate decarboxylase n=1 Tax=unclassified Halalkalibaculum TaxID=2964617 RepID=UPI00375522C2
MATFSDKIRQSIGAAGSTLCVGLDPHLHLLPSHLAEEFPDQNERVTYFLKKVIDITHPYCAAYKPNLAFFEALGRQGLETFSQVLEYIPTNKIVIADAKRGDIGSTAANYKTAYFDHWDVDAITLNPLMGFETLESYFNYPEKAIYALTLTSNPGAADFLEKPFAGYRSMAEYIAANLERHQSNSKTALGLVVGATQPAHLESVLSQHRTSPLLIPGVGTQGGTVGELVSVLKDHSGIPLVSSSRSILFAGGDSTNWQEAVLEKVTSYREQLTPITERYA